MKQLPTFTLLGDYREQQQQQAEKVQEYSNRVRGSEQELAVLEMRYKDAIARTVKGEDTSEELAQINAAKAATKQELENRKTMLEVVRKVQSNKTTTADLDKAFRAFQAQYQSEVVKPSENELKAAKEAYVNAYLEHAKKIEHFSVMAEDVHYTIKGSSLGNPYGVGFGTVDNRKNKTISIIDLDELAKNKRPESLRPPLKAVKNEKGHTVYVPVDEERDN